MAFQQGYIRTSGLANALILVARRLGGSGVVLHKDLQACKGVDSNGEDIGVRIHKDLWVYKCVKLDGGEINKVC